MSDSVVQTPTFAGVDEQLRQSRLTGDRQLEGPGETSRVGLEPAAQNRGETACLQAFAGGLSAVGRDTRASCCQCDGGVCSGMEMVQLLA
jgi:hypothetical protein